MKVISEELVILFFEDVLDQYLNLKATMVCCFN